MENPRRDRYSGKALIILPHQLSKIKIIHLSRLFTYQEIDLRWNKNDLVLH